MVEHSPDILARKEESHHQLYDQEEACNVSNPSAF